jgi:DNA modification methylase
MPTENGNQLAMNKVYWGDCRDSMRQMAKDGIKVQSCITSPPYYGLRDYGNGGQIGLEESPQKFVESLVEVFSCVWDILEDDGTLWMNLGDSYSAGGRGGGQEGGIQAGNKGSVTGEVFGAWKVEGFRPKNLLGIPWRVAIAMQDFGWNLRQDIIWHKPNPMPESVTDRCTKAHEYIFLFSKKQKYYFDHEAIKEPVKEDWGTRNRANGKYHNEGTGLTPHTGLEKSYEMANKRSVWTVNTSTYKGAHFATFPEKLVEPMILASSRVGNIILDPFFGSGTTGQVAQNLGRKWIGCELNKDYKELQNERLKQQGLELL